MRNVSLTPVPTAGILREQDQPLAIGGPNPTALEQVLVNLISNALKFVKPGISPHIQIKTEELKTKVRLSIQDNGIGIEPQYHKRIFQVFERFDLGYPGTGIGLAIVGKAIQRMQGHIGVESELGKGSCFWIELPKDAKA